MPVSGSCLHSEVIARAPLSTGVGWHDMKRATICLCCGALILAGCEVPQQEKLADCSTNDLQFSMRVQYAKPYAIILGVPQSQTGHLNFRGEMTLRQSTGVVARIPISSHDMTPCSWLDSVAGLSGYILTWSQTNHGERLSDAIVQGQVYDVRVTFEDLPPASSSLWLSSMKR